MQHFPLLEFPVDILFLILYELPLKDILNLASVSFINIYHVTLVLNYPQTDLQVFLLHL
jgi:hypothetical protein